MDKKWKAWVDENLQRGCEPEEILGILLKQNFPVKAIRGAMGAQFPEHSAQVADDIDYAALTKIRITREPSATRIDTPKLQLYVIEHFMSEAECDALVKIIEPTLRPSEITYGPKDFRTSKTSDLGLLKNPVVEALDKKIATTLGIQLGYSEAIQAQKYQVGEQFKAHTDYFEPGTDEYKAHAAHDGNRTWTFMVYLNDTPKGGGTRFTQIDKIFYPQKGKAVVWNNLYEDGTPNPDTMHWGMPIEAGTKTIITKWFREKGNGPMFY